MQNPVISLEGETFPPRIFCNWFKLFTWIYWIDHQKGASFESDLCELCIILTPLTIDDGPFCNQYFANVTAPLVSVSLVIMLLLLASKIKKITSKVSAI